MNRPVTRLCGGIAGIGLAILIVCCYFTVVYGRGNLEAGNFHRCQYWTERDARTGQRVTRWDTAWELMESTEGEILARIDAWFFGLAFVVTGTAIWVGEQAGRRESLGSF